jgi:hypothetical protein
MTNAISQLFTVEDALAKLTQTREQGVLIVARGSELLHIYVQDGFVVRAHSNTKEGADAVGQAIHWKESSFTWIRGIQPPNPAKNLHIAILELTAKYGSANRPKMVATAKLASALKKEVETKFRWYIVPQDRLMERVYLNKTSTVMGRDPECDCFVDHADVSWRHCLIDLQARGISVLDLNSTNGTFVNGILVRDAPLKPGDKLEIGPCAFVINRESDTP